MADTAASEAARQLISQRWGNQRPTKLARELARRAAEVGEPERSELLAALNRHAAREAEQEPYGAA